MNRGKRTGVRRASTILYERDYSRSGQRRAFIKKVAWILPSILFLGYIIIRLLCSPIALPY